MSGRVRLFPVELDPVRPAWYRLAPHAKFPFKSFVQQGVAFRITLLPLADVYALSVSFESMTRGDELFYRCFRG